MTGITTFPTGRLDLFVVDICEPAALELRVVVAEGIVGEELPLKDALGIEGLDLGVGRPIEVTSKSRTFEFHWEQYVAFSVRNESYWSREPDEPEFQSHFYTRSDSAFLEYVSATTFAGDDYPGPLTHWAIDSQNHCIAVVGHVAPEIRELDINDRIQLLVKKGWLTRR